MGFIDAVTGRCCAGEGTAVDRSGRCCGVGEALDACGVCGGGGVAVDAQGTCCRTALPPSGICCESGSLDDCGVCGGDNRCIASVTVEVPLDRVSAMTAEALAALLGMPTSSIGITALGSPFSSPVSSPGARLLTDSLLNLTALTLSVAPVEGQPGLSTQGLLAALLGWGAQPDIVTRSPGCGNQRCELGEACATANCAGGTQCIADCPINLATARCPRQGTKVCSGHGDCLGQSGYCGCYSGYAGASCGECASGYLPLGSYCVFLPGALATCSDGVRNGEEEGVDCGGPTCGQRCSESSDAAGSGLQSSDSRKLVLLGVAGGVCGLAIVVGVLLWKFAPSLGLLRLRVKLGPFYGVPKGQSTKVIAWPRKARSPQHAGVVRSVGFVSKRVSRASLVHVMPIVLHDSEHEPKT